MENIPKSQLSISHLVGCGGYGFVFKAKDLRRQHDVAVKTMINGTARGVRNTLQNEARALACIRSPYIGQIFGVCIESTYHAIVMEYYANGSLYSLLKRTYVSWDLRWRMVHETILGMTYLHSCGMLHLDLKAQNVLLDDYFHIKICDFGLATSTDAFRDPGSIRGTASHTAPEAFLGHHASPALDVFSFGILLWEIITTRQPYESFQSIEKLVNKVCNEHQRPDLRLIGRDVPAEYEVYTVLVPLMQKCWQHDPGSRGNFQEFVGISEIRNNRFFKEAKLTAGKLINEMDSQNYYYNSPCNQILSYDLDDALTRATTSETLGRLRHPAGEDYRGCDDDFDNFVARRKYRRLDRSDENDQSYRSLSKNCESEVRDTTELKYRSRTVPINESYNLDRSRVPLKDPNRPITREDMIRLSSEICKYWQFIARNLGLSDGDVEVICYDHGFYGNEEMAYQMLRLWREQTPEKATLQALADACISRDQRNAIVRFIQRGFLTDQSGKCAES